ncbi:long-chain-acyl-CoA synthetase [Nocardia sp. NPDC023852]|uniref:long-chain-acyl-CoA synthetase n=1 Tax=Nocardia sp. NPDC023852 TaxID=3154697 RepID=UPI0033DFC5A2
MGNNHTGVRSTVGLRDVVRALPGLARDMPGIVRNVGALLTSPDSKRSVGLVFQEAAHRHPDQCFVRFEGRDYSYGEANTIVNRYASVLVGYGVQRGDVVGIMLTNRPETLLLILATVKLGATAGMLNHHQRADVLAHSIGLLRSRVLVVGSECRAAVDELRALPTVVVAAEDLEQASHSASAEDPEVCAEITAAERAFLVFTSGTTGLPKASIMSHLRWSKSFAGFGGAGVRLRARDTLYCCLPLYHNNALTVALSSVLAGDATLALGRKFSASRFWPDLIGNQATAFVYVGELCRYLLNQPAEATDRLHQVRVMVGNGLRPELWDAFRERFGVRRIVEFYGASEVPLAFINIFNADKTAGFGALPYAVVEYDNETGRASRGLDGRLRRVGRGNVGLLLSKITARTPFDSYTDEEAGEQKLVRDAFEAGDVWFDTGDLVLDQGLNHIAFVDRLGDTFRWKGENVATTEVEAVIAAEDTIDQAAVYGVAIPGADGKAGMAAVTLRQGACFDGAGLAQRLYQRLPFYAVPLFICVVDELEQTSTFRSRKVELRKTGYSSEVDGRLYVLEGRDNGYIDAYDGYATEVAEGKRPQP